MRSSLKKCLIRLLVLLTGVAAPLQNRASPFQKSTGPRASDISELFRRAESGEASAQIALAQVLHSGDEVRKDELSALNWACEAAQQGNISAQLFLATSYANLKYENPKSVGYSFEPDTESKIPPDVQTAFFWITVAAQRLPEWDPIKLSKKSKRARDTDEKQKENTTPAGLGARKKGGRDIWEMGNDLSGSPVFQRERQLVSVAKRAIAPKVDYRSMVAIEEAALRWEPNNSVPWTRIGNCHFVQQDTDVIVTIDHIRSGRHSLLPTFEAATPKGTKTDASVALENNSGYILVAYFRGPTTLVVKLAPHSSKSVDLRAGSYLIGVEIPDASLLPFYREQDLKAGIAYRAQPFWVQ